MTDETLMEAVRDGASTAEGHAAFDALFDRYRTTIWGFFRRRVADRSRAEDLVQETFTALLTAAPRYEPRAAFRSFLFGIAFNILASDRRQRHATGSNDGDAPLALVAGNAPDLDAVLHVRRALASLDAIDRDVLMLREYEALAYADIAAVLAIPVNTVRSRLFRARMALKEKLQ